MLDCGTSRLQIFEADGTHLYTRKDLGIEGGNNYKGLEWDGGAGGRLAIANGSGNDARLFVGQ